jgi:L-ribulose-5-phosphate 3-epimerase
MSIPTTSRRHFLAAGSAFAAGLALRQPAAADQAIPHALKGRLFKTLKIGMVKEGNGLVEKFAIAREAGFKGVELQAPNYDVDEAREAVAKTGLVIDGNVQAGHWKVRHTSPDPATRAAALDELLEALRRTHAVGGHSVLVVCGKGEDGSHEECWERSIANISQAIPLAAELGVSILIENVWNQFCYDHDGGSDQTADLFVQYIDAFNSPWVAMHFDIGNHWKYGSMGDWIRQLGTRRIYKLDIKGFSRAEGKFTPIGEGDIDYADVRKALHEINYHGWLAAEVAGGDLEYLKGVSTQMDDAFGL